MSGFIKKLTPFLRKPSLNHTKPEVRLQALAEVDLTQAAEQANFLTWFTNESHQPTLEAGLALFCKTDQQEEQLQKLALTNQQLNLVLIKLAPKTSLAFSCLNQLEAEEEIWLDLAQNCRTTQLRQAAAEKLTSEAALEELVARVHNDKGLQRFAKQQLESIKAKQLADAAQEEAIQEVLTQLTDLTNAKDKQLFSAKLQHLTDKWQAVASTVTTQDLAKYQNLMQLAKQQEAELLAEEARLKSLAEEKQRQAEEAAKQAALEEEQRQAAVAKQAEQLLVQKQQKAADKEAQALIKAEEEQNKQKVKQLTADINRLEELVSQGKIQAATKQNARLNQEISSHPAAAKISHKHQQKYKQLSAKLQELNSWQGFVAAPKRQELLEQMQALAEDTGMQPQIKADKIQQLQHQWRELGSAAANKEMWLEFKQAADIAFEPCKAWFAEQNEIKNYNQQQKEIICAELESLTANQGQQGLSESGLDQLLQKVHNEWHRFNPVARTEGKKLAKRFQLAIQPLKDQLYDLRQINIDSKRQLIAKAKALLTAENLNQAIEENKQLQEEWRQLGRAPGSLEPRLWKEFRAACDELFNQRSASNLAKLEASEEEFNLALAELQQAEEMLATNQLAAAEKHLAASYSQGLVQKHLRQLANRQQEVKTALAAAKNLANKQAEAEEFNAELAAFSSGNQQPEEALKLLVGLEILAEQPSAPENQQLRLELQIEQMNLGKTSLTPKQQHAEILNQLKNLNQLGLGKETPIYQQLVQLVEGYIQG